MKFPAIAATESHITSIGQHRVDSSGDIIGVEFPKGVTSVDSHTFEKYPNLVRIDLPDTVETIADDALNGHTKLEVFTAAYGLKVVGRRAFEGCTALRDVKIPNTCHTVGDDAFKDCVTLEQLIVPHAICDKVYSFTSGCPRTTELIIRNLPTMPFSTNDLELELELDQFGVGNKLKTRYTTIGGQYDSSYRPVRRIDEHVASLGQHRVDSLGNVVGVEVPKSLVSVDIRFLKKYPNLVSVDLPDHIEKIDDFAFKGRTNLEEIKLSRGLKAIGSCAFEGCTALREVEIPDTCHALGMDAFKDCTGLTHIGAPHTLADRIAVVTDGCGVDTEISIRAERPLATGDNRNVRFSETNTTLLELRSARALQLGGRSSNMPYMSHGKNDKAFSDRNGH